MRYIATLVLFLGALCSLRAEPLVFTLAGSGPRGWDSGAIAGDGAPAGTASLNGPTSVATSPRGILFTDYWNDRVRAIDPNGIMRTVAGNGWPGYETGSSATTSNIWGPWGVASRGSEIIFSDTYNALLRSVDASGALSPLAGQLDAPGFSGDGGSATNAQLDFPLGIATDASGNVYVADSWNHRVRRVQPNGTITTVAGNGWSDSFGRGRFGGDGGPATEASLNWPTAVALDTQGNLFIADTYNQRIRRVDATSKVITTVAGSGAAGNTGDDGPATDAALNFPSGLAVATDGTLFVSDSANHRIRAVSNGTIRALAGDGTPGLSEDPIPASQARFQAPAGLAIAPDGGLLVADAGNNRIRKILFGPVGMVQGVVRDANTQGPLPGASVTWNGMLVIAGADGSFRLALSAGDQTVRAAMPTFGPAEETVTVPVDGTVVHDFSLPSGFVGGRVVDDGGHIIVGAKVTSADTETVTDANGAFILRAAPGTANLNASAEGYGPSGPQAMTVQNGQTTSVVLMVHRLTTVPVTLPLDYDWISSHENPGNYTTPSSDFAFPAEQLPESSAVFHLPDGARVIDFLFPNKADGAMNAMQVNGQTVPVPPGRYAAVHMLEASQFGTRTAALTATYSDGSTSADLRWSDWAWAVIGQQLGANESVGIACDHRHQSGQPSASPPVDILHSQMPLDASRTLTAIAFPADTQIGTSDAYAFAMVLDRIGGTIYGDVDGDGAITGADGAKALACAAGFTTLDAASGTRADCWPAYTGGGFGDGRIDMGDATAILRLAGKR